MDTQALNQVNDRLQNPVDFADAPSAYLGLFVVGRLAQDMGITVRLASADPTGEGKRRGTIAFIDLPVSLLSQESAAPLKLEQEQDGVAHRTEALDAAQEQGEHVEPAAAPVPQAAPQPVVAETAAPSPATTATPPDQVAPAVPAVTTCLLYTSPSPRDA